MHLVDVLEQIGCDLLPKGIKNDARSLAASQLRRWHEVTVSGDKDYGVGLLFQGDAGYIQPNSHVHGLLLESCHEIIVIQICHVALSGQ